MNGLDVNNDEVNKTWRGTEWNETGYNVSEWLNKTKTPRNVCADSLQIRTFKILAWVILLVFSFLGNILLIAVIRKSHELRRSPVNIFILGMSVSDLSIPLIAVPYNIKQIYVGMAWLGGNVGSILCKIVPFAIDVPTAVSILTLLVIAVERFECVYRPTRRPFTARIHRKLVCFIWLFAALSHIFYFYSFKVVHVRVTDTFYCVPLWHREPSKNKEALKIQASLLIAVLFHLPVIILTILYSSIIVTLRRRKVEMVEHLTSCAARKREKQNRKVAFMLVTVVAVFVLAYTPFVVFTFLLLFSPQGFQTPCNFSFIVHFLFYSYSAINPVIYYCFNNKYRQGFKQLFSFHIVCAPASCSRDYQLRSQTDGSLNRGPVELNRHSTLSTTVS